MILYRMIQNNIWTKEVSPWYAKSEVFCYPVRWALRCSAGVPSRLHRQKPVPRHGQAKRDQAHQVNCQIQNQRHHHKRRNPRKNLRHLWSLRNNLCPKMRNGPCFRNSGRKRASETLYTTHAARIFHSISRNIGCFPLFNLKTSPSMPGIHIPTMQTVWHISRLMTMYALCSRCSAMVQITAAVCQMNRGRKRERFWFVPATILDMSLLILSQILFLCRMTRFRWMLRCCGKNPIIHRNWEPCITNLRYNQRIRMAGIGSFQLPVMTQHPN